MRIDVQPAFVKIILEPVQHVSKGEKLGPEKACVAIRERNREQEVLPVGVVGESPVAFQLPRHRHAQAGN